MALQYKTVTFPQSRIATFDVYDVGMFKHHIAAMLEFDVTDSRKKIRELRRKGENVSFNAWITHAICRALEAFPEAAAFKSGKRKLVLFEDIRISMMVEKLIDNQRIPIPFVIDKAQHKSMDAITREIEEVRNQVISGKDITLNKSSEWYERLYYHLPGIIRKSFWRFFLRHPKIAYRQMGNVVITSLGMVGRLNGWFIHKSIHPLSFGIGAVIKKPLVVNDEIKIREVLNMTVLLDHDVIDGAPMVRFLRELSKNMESTD